MPRAALGQTGPENPYFAISRPWRSGAQKRKLFTSFKFREENFGADGGFPPKVPLPPGNCVFLLSAQNFSKCQGAAPGQKGLKDQYFAISRPWGSSRRKCKMEKTCAFFGRNFWGGRSLFPKVPLGPGNRVFPFLARNLSKCQKLP